MSKQYTVGTEVTCHGFPGTITEVCQDKLKGMVVVRLARGSVCVPLSELIRFDRVAA